MKIAGIALTILSILLLIPFSFFAVTERDPSLTIAAGAGLIGGCILLAAAHVAEHVSKDRA